MAKQTMKYETIMIFNTQLNEEGITALADKFKALIAENGTIDEVEEWGKRRLAYPIEDEIEGYYLLVRFTSHPSFPAELDRVYKITDGVLRTLIVVNEAEEKPAKAAAPVVAEPAAVETESAEENA
jgi:small subunit ribosomal protein S6